MCAGKAYWINIGRIVYGMSKQQMLGATGRQAESPTMNVSSRYVFDHSPKQMALIGPVETVAAEALALQKRFRATR